MVTIGAWSPTPATMIPSVAARLYAGPVDASAMTTEENIPSVSPRSPFRPTPEPGAGRPPDTPLLPKSLTFDSNAGVAGVQIQGRPMGGPPLPSLLLSLPSPTPHAPVACAFPVGQHEAVTGRSRINRTSTGRPEGNGCHG
ncbi:hypothetical protein SRO_4227 [Streptomyces rochei]|nr:hypothetical protein SRO_4227 [Streptomyces rochei]